MPRPLAPALLLLTLAATALVPGAASATTTGRLLVLLRPGASAPSLQARAATATAVIAARGARRAGPSVPEIGLVTVRPDHGQSLSALAATLRRDPRVRAVETEHRATPRVLLDDPAWTQAETAPGTPEGTPIEWWAPAEDLPAAWDISDGTGARVGIVDTGVDASHPDLAGRIVAANDVDGDAGDQGTDVDEDGHGTHVASMACATGGNGIGLVGAGYRCSLIVEKSDLTDSSVAAGIVDAANRGAEAINMSFGTDGRPAPGPTLLGALKYARAKGAVLVAAAADQPVTQQGDPANVLQPTGTGPDLKAGMGLSVTAARRDGAVAWFAGRGTQISLAAYGTFGPQGPRGLLGAFPSPTVNIERPSDMRLGCNCRTMLAGDDRYAYIAGTSMAAPQVAAIAALMRHLNPALAPADVERIIKATARRPAGTGWTDDLGWGILDGGAALRAARDTDRTAPVSSLSFVRRSARTVTLRVRSTDPAPPGVLATGVASVQVWRTVGKRRTLLATTRTGIVRVRVTDRRTLLLSSRATDRAGNRERLPSRPTLRVPR